MPFNSLFRRFAFFVPFLLCGATCASVCDPLPDECEDDDNVCDGNVVNRCEQPVPEVRRMTSREDCGSERTCVLRASTGSIKWPVCVRAKAAECPKEGARSCRDDGTASECVRTTDGRLLFQDEACGASLRCVDGLCVARSTPAPVEAVLHRLHVDRYREAIEPAPIVDVPIRTRAKRQRQAARAGHYSAERDQLHGVLEGHDRERERRDRIRDRDRSGLVRLERCGRWGGGRLGHPDPRKGPERIASSPAAPIAVPPSRDSAFAGVGSGSGTSLSVALRNRLAQAFDAADIAVLTQSGPSSSGPWTSTTPANFWSLGCVYAQKDTKMFTGTKPSDHRYIRIEASRGVFNPVAKQWTKVKIERIVDTTPPKAADFKLPTAPIMKQ